MSALGIWGASHIYGNYRAVRRLRIIRSRSTQSPPADTYVYLPDEIQVSVSIAEQKSYIHLNIGRLNISSNLERVSCIGILVAITLVGYSILAPRNGLGMLLSVSI